MIDTTHLGVYGIVIKEDKILLVKKSRGAYIGKYDLPGGSFEHGEKPIETLKREFEEEAGIKITKAKIIDANSAVVKWENPYINKMENMHHIGIIYEIESYEGTIKEDADGLDSLGACWYTIENLKEEDISPLTYDALKLKGLK